MAAEIRNMLEMEKLRQDIETKLLAATTGPRRRRPGFMKPR